MPTCIRSAGVATAYVVMHCVLIAIVQVSPLALTKISWRYFLIFLFANVMFVVILFVAYPETRGKTLEEMNVLFGDEASRESSSFQLKNHILIKALQVAETLEEAGMNVKEEKEQKQHVEVVQCSS
jgi:hypothetical protein